MTDQNTDSPSTTGLTHPLTWQSLRLHIYTPYSKLTEVAVCRSEDDILYPGVRIDNIAFPDTIDAIQTAAMNCLSDNKTVKTIYLPENIDQPSNLAHWKQMLPKATFETTNALPDLRIYNPVLSLEEHEIPAKLDDLIRYAHIEASDFPVTSLLHVGENKYIPGANIELHVWRYGLCAERVAIARAITYGYTEDVDHLYVHAPKSNFSSPCGACRQVIFEHMPEGMLTMFHGDGTESEIKFREMLPYNFTSTFLDTKHNS